MASTTIQGPAIGLPPDTKEAGQRVDFKRGSFALLIETKGIRIAWSRGSTCPCKPVNTQTQQSDPNCSLCRGVGFIWFRPLDYSPPVEAGTLTDIQNSIVEDEQAVVIRGISTSVARTEEAYDKLGTWVFGSHMVTVRPENKIGYYDRLTALDAQLPYSEIIFVDAKDATLPVKMRYKATCINFLRSETKRFSSGADFVIDATGKIQFLPGREAPVGERLAVHYLHHPVALVMEHVNSFRDSLVAFKASVDDLTTPLGNPQDLPIRVLARLEYLISSEAQPA